MEEKESTISGSPDNTDSGPPTPMSGGGGGFSHMVAETQLGSAPTAVSGDATTVSGGDSLGKKKRGRPRKYDAEGNLNPAYVAAAARKAAKLAAAPPGFTLTMPGGEYGGGGGKKGRGKYNSSSGGSTNWHHHAPSPLGELFANTAGGDFTPHILTVQTGEDVAAKILSFSQKGPRGICVLSANGAISNVTIRQPGSSGGLLTYEGRFEILSLTGSYTMSEAGGVTSRTGGLSISLAGPDGRVVGGSVAGWLTAASPIQVVVGSFVPYGYNNHKVQKRKYHRESSNTAPISTIPEPTAAANLTSHAMHGIEATGNPLMQGAHSPSEADDSMGSGHNLEWNNGSEPSSDHRIYPDINVSVPGI